MQMFHKAARKAARISILAVLPLVSIGVSPGAAQPAIIPEEKSQNGVVLNKQRFIRLRHVSASLMAFWLDPKNNPAPLEMPIPGGAIFDSTPAPAFLLPAGVERIIALEGSKSLVVLGTEVGVKHLQTIVAFLDKPIREIEIEVQIAEIPQEKLSGTWEKLAAQSASQKPAMGFLKRDEQTQLREMWARREAVVLALPTQKILNGATRILDFKTPADILSQRLTIPGRPPGDFESPMPIFPPPQGMAPMPGMGGTIMPPRIVVPKPFDMIRLQITPTLNVDGSVTLLIEGTGLAPRDLQSIANISAGQSLVFALPVFNFQFSKRAFLVLTPRTMVRIQLD